MTTVRNIGKRSFIIKGVAIHAGQVVSLDDKVAEKLLRVYSADLVETKDDATVTVAAEVKETSKPKKSKAKAKEPATEQAAG